MIEKRQGPGFHLLIHSAHLLDDHLRDLLRPLGIHAGQARVIHAIDRMGETSQRQLASEFNVTPASMSQMTNRLMNNGFIELRRDLTDRRSTLVSLTPDGKKLLKRIIAVWQVLDQIIVDAIGTESAEQLFARSWDLRNALGGKAPGTKDALQSRSQTDGAG